MIEMSENEDNNDDEDSKDGDYQAHSDSSSEEEDEEEEEEEITLLESLFKADCELKEDAIVDDAVNWLGQSSHGRQKTTTPGVLEKDKKLLKEYIGMYIFDIILLYSCLHIY